MKKLVALTLVLIICSMSMVSCQFSLFTWLHNKLDETPDSFTYTSFTDDELSLMEAHLGEAIPFLPTDEYDLASFYDDGNYEDGFRFTTLYNTKEDFYEYLHQFTDYTIDRVETDDYGISWYYLFKGKIVVVAAFYQDLGLDIVDVFAYIDDEAGQVKRGTLTNHGIGLPYSESGVYDIDFTLSQHAHSVNDLEMYKNGCPSVGSPAVLVIPVQFSDVTAKSKGFSIDTIKQAFNGASGSTSYYSVDEYYRLSSYGALDLDITVLDSWFTPEHPSNYYREKSIENITESHAIAEQIILNEALDYLDDTMDLSKFDSDGNGFIDAVIMIDTLDVSADNSLTWAFRYWNLYRDEEDNLIVYDGVSAHDYAWMSYSFMHESVDQWGRPVYNNKKTVNTKTYIHEMGHILGGEDYYDTSYEDPLGPLHGKDVMDTCLGDHNPYSKFSYGWITSSRLVTTDSQITLTLENFQKSGDTIIVANNFDPALGVYQEYFVLMYYSASELNKSKYPYFDYDGVVIYHVNATLSYEDRDGDMKYWLNNNNSAETHKSLLELVGIDFGIVEIPHFIFTEGNSIVTLSDDSGQRLPYIITVDDISGGNATLTFKNIH